MDDNTKVNKSSVESKKNKMTFLAVVAVLAVLLVLFVIFAVAGAKKDKKPKEPETTEPSVSTTAPVFTTAAPVSTVDLPTDPYAPGKYYVNTNEDPLGLRESADADSELINSIPKGDEVELDRVSGEWAHVKWYPSGSSYYTEGWVRVKYLAKTVGASSGDGADAASTSVVATYVYGAEATTAQ